MATAKDIDNYGGEKVDAAAMRNPTSQLAASHHNRQAEDTAHMTRTSYRSIVRFTTVSAAAPQTVSAANVYHWSHSGDGAAEKPVITKTATGRYTLTWPASFTDDLSATESIVFWDGHVSSCSGDPVDTLHDSQVLTIASNVVTIVVKAGGVAADVGDNSAAVFDVTVWMR